MSIAHKIIRNLDRKIGPEAVPKSIPNSPLISWVYPFVNVLRDDRSAFYVLLAELLGIPLSNYRTLWFL